MNVVKVLSRRTFFWVFFFSAVLWLLIDAAIYFAIQMLSLKMSAVEGDAVIGVYQDTIRDLRTWIDLVAAYYIPVSIVLALGFILLLWLCLRISFSGPVKKGTTESRRVSETADRKPSPAVPDPAAVKRNEQRLYIHLFSLLQREGRLMDFLGEDIEDYEDGEIGAAVRSIHENCRKIIYKYLTPKAILPEEEDTQITVEPGFDPNIIKLTGNVTGNPPFKGVIRHKGWTANKVELPILAGERNPRIIAPAEVEIL